MKTDTEALEVGPALDAAVAELMGVPRARLWRGSEFVQVVDNPYSTSDEWACKVLDWLVAQGWGYEVRGAADGAVIRLRMEANSREWSTGKPIPLHVESVFAPTLAEAVCRAALETREQE